MWRGQSKIEWPIHSGAYRRVSLEKSKVKERDIVWYEETLLKQATHKGFRVSNGILLNDFELLAKLQHHGAATRLMDFSKNVLVGLWFSANANPDEHGLLMGIHSSHIAGDTEGKVDEGKETYSEFTDELTDEHNPFFIEPPIVSPRVSSQHGVFIYSSITDENHGSLILPDNEKAKIFISISPSLKKEALKVLEELFDIREPTLFPDLDGFSQFNSTNTPQSKMFRW